jgi:hypothetical protein
MSIRPPPKSISNRKVKRFIKKDRKGMSDKFDILDFQKWLSDIGLLEGRDFSSDY